MFYNVLGRGIVQLEGFSSMDLLLSIFHYYLSFFYIPQCGSGSYSPMKESLLLERQNAVLGVQCLVRWNLVYRPNDQGCLGIRRLRDFNIALLAKWWWKLLSNHSTPLIHVVFVRCVFSFGGKNLSFSHFAFDF